MILTPKRVGERKRVRESVREREIISLTDRERCRKIERVKVRESRNSPIF